MTEHARIGEKRLIAGPGVNIGAANAGGNRFNQDFVRGRRRYAALLPHHAARFGDHQRFHVRHRFLLGCSRSYGENRPRREVALCEV